MKKFLLALGAAVMILAVSCKDDKNKNNNEKPEVPEAPTEVQSQEYIEARINDIYTDALGSGEDVDTKYCTPEFLELQDKVYNKENQTGYLYIDHDHWLMAQDAHNPSFLFEKAEDINAHTAVAYVKVKAFDDQENYDRVKLILKYNGEDWMVDDIEEEFEGVFYSQRKIYEEALAEK